MAIDPNRCLDVPEGFDDSDDDEGQVHPIARRLFMATTAAGAFGKAQEWVGKHEIRVADVSWDHFFGEDEPYALSLYFIFELDDEEP